MLASAKKVLQQVSDCTPSKWGGGTGLLWRGNTVYSYLHAIAKGPSGEVTASSFLFESCRVAIYHYAKFLGLGSRDTVEVIGFTCDAVTDAFHALDCKVNLYDCDLDLVCRDFTISPNTTLIVCQASFGVVSLPDAVLAEAKERGIAILFDKSLSYGAKDFDSSEPTIHPTVLSFEVSKSITAGWGGLLMLPSNDMDENFNSYYDTLHQVSFVDDCLRVLHTVSNLLLVPRGNRFCFGIWLILRALGWHRASVNSSMLKYKRRSKLGMLTTRAVLGFQSQIPMWLAKSNENHERLRLGLEALGLIVISNVSERHSTPRLVFLAKQGERDMLAKWLRNHDIELGCWFDHLPIRDYETESLPKTKILMGLVCNFSCHWTLSFSEIDRMVACTGQFYELNRHDKNLLQ